MTAVSPPVRLGHSTRHHVSLVTADVDENNNNNNNSSGSNNNNNSGGGSILVDSNNNVISSIINSIGSIGSSSSGGGGGGGDEGIGRPLPEQQRWLLQALRAKHGHDYQLTAVGDIRSGASCQLVGPQQLAACSQLWCLTVTGSCSSSGRHQLLRDQLVVKLLPENEIVRQLVIKNGMAVCETMMYRSLLPLLVKHEQSYGHTDLQHFLVPCLYTEVCEYGQCAIVLDNLQRRGFMTVDTLKLEKSQLMPAVASLAKFAAVSHSWLTKTNTKHVPFLMPSQYSSGGTVSQYVALGVDRLQDHPALLQRPALLHHLHQLSANCSQLVNRQLQLQLASQLPVVCHGDYRDGNLLLRADGDGSWHVSALDWQVSRLGGPAFDLLYLLLFSVSRFDRPHLEPDCVQVYCHHLNAKLAALDCRRRYTRQQLASELSAAKLLGLVWCLAAVKFWETVPDWADHIIDLLIEVESLGLFDSL